MSEISGQVGIEQPSYEQVGDDLVIAGRTVSKIVNEFGSPLYVYDLKKLKDREKELRRRLPSDLMITYAVKANPHPELVQLLGSLYDGIDIASMGEMEIALAAGISAAKMSFAGPGKSVEELRFAVEHSIGTVSLESERELEHLETVCKALNKKIDVLIRVNPAFEFARSGLKMGGGSKQFGIDSERVPDLITKLVKSEYVHYKGIHIFSGTQNLNADSVLEAFEKILDYSITLSEETGMIPEVLNLGGGFGIPYFKGDKVLDLARVGEGITALLLKAKTKLPDTHFKIELGRFLVGESGYYISRVLYRKVSRGAVFLILNGGMHHHLAASGNISQSPIRRQMVVLAGNRIQAEMEKVNVAGPLCTPLDTFGLGIELPILQEGDLIVIPNSGAYGLSMSPYAFLGHRPPKEILL